MRAERLRETLLPALGILILLGGGSAVAWIYVTQPESLAEVGTKAQVAAGVYQVDEARFASGLALFRREQFAAARDEWTRADPEQRDARTQFYLAYAFYREGWGRFHHDDVAVPAGARRGRARPGADRGGALVVGRRRAEDPAARRSSGPRSSAGSPPPGRTSTPCG